ncbi:MAG: hypothetical protein ABL994_22505 [Verrucomicrobiales bacterium]
MMGQMKSAAIRQGLNLYLKGKYGEITSLEFDGKARSLRLQLLLDGEDSAIDVEVARFDVEEGDSPAVVLSGVRVSRAWMQELARTQVEGKRLRIPPAMTGMVKLMLS